MKLSVWKMDTESVVLHVQSNLRYRTLVFNQHHFKVPLWSFISWATSEQQPHFYIGKHLLIQRLVVYHRLDFTSKLETYLTKKKLIWNKIVKLQKSKALYVFFNVSRHAKRFRRWTKRYEDGMANKEKQWLIDKKKLRMPGDQVRDSNFDIFKFD